MACSICSRRVQHWFAELGPGEKSKTEIDGCGVEGVGRTFDLNAKIGLGIKASSLGDKYQCKVPVDLPVALLVGIGNRAA